MKSGENRWVIFGTGYAGKSAFLILDKKVDFFYQQQKQRETKLFYGWNTYSFVGRW